MSFPTTDYSTFLIKSTKNKSFGTAFCIHKDKKGSYLLTAGHVVESCGIENLFIESHQAKLLHISKDSDSIDLALVYVEGLTDTMVLKLSEEKANVEEKFDIVGYRPHKKDHAKEPLKGFIKKSYPLDSNKREIYELSINDGDSIEQGYSGSAVVSAMTGLVIAIATDRKSNGKQAYATPAYYLKEIWQEIPEKFFESFTDSNPYKGLNSFEYKDRENYYGREKESQEIASKLKTTKLFTLLGASGSGKSSLIFAGIVPLVESDDVEILSFRPLAEPFKNVASVFIPTLYTDKLEQLRKEKELANDLFKNNITLIQLVEMLLEKKESKHLYLIIDQFEELFTLTKEPNLRNIFLDQLLLLINSDLKVTLLLSMRADFLSHISYYEPFNKAYNEHSSQMLSLLSQENLKRIIEEPAKRKGVSFQEGLVERIIEEIENEAGQLPLLEFALEQFWTNKKGRVITHTILDEMQSISHSISHYADKVYKNNPKYHASIKKVLIKLVNVGSGTEDTRRIASFDEFDKEARETITLLANKRLIVTEEGNIDIVHEALIREWQRLQKWINQHRDFLEWEKHLRDDIKFYVENGEKKEDLLVESKLLRAKEFLESHEEYITSKDREFILKSIEIDQKKRRNFKILLVAGFAFLVGVIVVIWFFFKDAEQANNKSTKLNQELVTTIDTLLKYGGDSLTNQVFSHPRIYQLILDKFKNSTDKKILKLVAGTYHNIGVSYGKKKEYDIAITYYNKALKINPKLFKTYFNIGICYNRKHEYEKALNSYLKAFGINPKDDEIIYNLGVSYYNVGNIYLNKKKFEKAIKFYKKAITFKKNKKLISASYSNIGNIYLNKKKYMDAIDFFEKSIKVNPSDKEGISLSYNNIGYIYNIEKKYKQAIIFFQKAIQVNPKNYDAYIDMGDTYSKIRNYRKSIDSYYKIMGVNSGKYDKYIFQKMINNYQEIINGEKVLSDKIYNEMGVIYARQGDFNSALKAYIEAININSKNREVYGNLGVIYVYQSKYNQAIKAYMNALKNSNWNYFKYFQQAVSYDNQKQYNHTLVILYAIINSNIDYPEINYHIGMMYSKKNNYIKAIEFYKKAIQKNPKFEFAYNNLGNAYLKEKEYIHAIKAYQEVIKINPFQYKAYKNLGNAFLGMHKEKKAIESYQKAIEIHPDYYEAFYKIGIAYKNIKKYTKSINAFENSLEVNLKNSLAYIKLFELQLINNKLFDKRLKKEFKKRFTTNTEAYIQYEILIMFQNIFRGKEENIKELENKYKDINLSSLFFNELDIWISKTEENKKKDKLKEALKIFKSHKKD